MIFETSKFFYLILSILGLFKYGDWGLNFSMNTNKKRVQHLSKVIALDYQPDHNKQMWI